MADPGDIQDNPFSFDNFGKRDIDGGTGARASKPGKRPSTQVCATHPVIPNDAMCLSQSQSIDACCSDQTERSVPVDPFADEDFGSTTTLPDAAGKTKKGSYLAIRWWMTFLDPLSSTTSNAWQARKRRTHTHSRPSSHRR